MTVPDDDWEPEEPTDPIVNTDPLPDELMVGSSVVWPWTAYVLADVPDLETVAKVTNILREAEVEGARLWKYLRVEARVGRPLFFANA